MPRNPPISYDEHLVWNTMYDISIYRPCEASFRKPVLHPGLRSLHLSTSLNIGKFMGAINVLSIEEWTHWDLDWTSRLIKRRRNHAVFFSTLLCTCFIPSENPSYELAEIVRRGHFFLINVTMCDDSSWYISAYVPLSRFQGGCSLDGLRTQFSCPINGYSLRSEFNLMTLYSYERGYIFVRWNFLSLRELRKA